MDGHINAEPVKPVCFLECPELDSLEAKSKMAAKILAAVDKAYRDVSGLDYGQPAYQLRRAFRAA